MLQTLDAHARHIHAMLRDPGPEAAGDPPPYIKRSWLRCLNQYHLDPQSQHEPHVLARQDRLARKERNQALTALADAEMAHLYHQLAGSGHSIILTDRDGVLLDYYGDLSFRNAAFRTGLVLGALWDEEHGGTNGMGTCLIERTPLIVHRNQHFFSRNTGLTCCAAPIFDPAGELLAVLDASGESDRAQQHTLVLVNMSAQMIENRLFLQHFRDAVVVRFHSRPELLGTWGEGIIALDDAGRIAALDRNAVFQLGLTGAGELLGAPLERVFNLSVEALLARTQRKSFHPLPLYDARHGGRVFVIAQAPERRHPGRARAAEEKPAAVSAGQSPLEEFALGDAVMARNIQAVRRNPNRDVPILLTGESGTGKECFARALHASVERPERPFVAVHCGSLGELELTEELFGPGTGAAAARGRILQANGGTLFLDDVGELPPALQLRLLRLIEDREIQRPGEAAQRLDIRLITATRAGLQEKLLAGTFREDLYYRLQGLALTLPPLRERQNKPALIRQVFAQECAAAPSVRMSQELVDALEAYRWPGNVRELRNVLRGMIAMRTDDRLDTRALPPDLAAAVAGRADRPSPVESDLNPLQRAERAALAREIECCRGNISQVAQRLGIGRNTLYRKMRRLGIELPERVKGISTSRQN